MGAGVVVFGEDKIGVGIWKVSIKGYKHNMRLLGRSCGSWPHMGIHTLRSAYAMLGK